MRASGTQALRRGPRRAAGGEKMLYMREYTPEKCIAYEYRDLEKQNTPEKAQQIKSPTAKNVARPKSRVALRATSLAATVAQNGYDVDRNVSPAGIDTGMRRGFCLATCSMC